MFDHFEGLGLKGLKYYYRKFFPQYCIIALLWFLTESLKQLDHKFVNENLMNICLIAI